MENAGLAGQAALRGWNALSRLGRLLAGSFIFCQAEIFRLAGGFSHSLYAGEELDFSRRVKALARARGQTLVILSRHPLATSARKISLYTFREHLRFFSRVVFGAGRVLRDKQACNLWYDGRR
jgi:hypothetical protein